MLIPQATDAWLAIAEGEKQRQRQLKKIDRIVQMAEAAQRRAKSGMWRA